MAEHSRPGSDTEIAYALDASTEIAYALDASTEIAYALDASKAVRSALAAPPTERYRCLACGGSLALGRSAEGKIFRHSGVRRCDGSEVARRAARQILRGQILEELRSHGSVVWHRPCAGVAGPCRDRLVFEQRSPAPDWDEVRSGPEIDGFRFDVAVLARQRMLIGFVLRAGGRSGQPEAISPAEAGWAVLLALEDVLAFRPRVPLDSAGEGTRCRLCAQEAANRRGREGPDWRGSGAPRVWREVMAAAGRPDDGRVR